ncbi:lipopolysaccharide heptosyltransferase II [Candidatus Hydrogenedentota bacterium]
MPPLDNVKTILVRGPNWLGDAVMASPTYRALRKTYPEASITLLSKAPWGALAKGTDWFDRIIDYGSRGKHPGFLGSTKLGVELRANKFDLALVLPNSFSSAFMAFISGSRKRVGYQRDGRTFLLTDSMPRPSENGKFKPTYMGQYYLQLAKLAGVDSNDNRTGVPIMFSPELSATSLGRIAKLMASPEERFVGISPGASFGSSKLWDPAKMASSADTLAERLGLRVALTGAPGENDMLRAVRGHLRTESIVLCDKKWDLNDVCAFVRQMDVLIATDSGTRHIAAALGVPTVVVMGPNDPRYSGSTWEKTTVVRIDIDCGPCQKKTCPTDKECMERITPVMVVEAAEGLLKKSY